MIPQSNESSNKTHNNSDAIFGPPTDTVVDFAASDNFGKLTFTSWFLSGIHPDPNPIPAVMPNVTSIASIHIAEFNHPEPALSACSPACEISCCPWDGSATMDAQPTSLKTNAESTTAQAC